MMKRIIDRYDMLPAGGTVLCAVSGGADSVYMLFHIAQLAQERGCRVVCAHYNHQLRGDEADRDEDFVRGLCAELDIPCICSRGNVAAYAAARGIGTEEAARIMRYAFLEEAADQAEAVRILTAHTADDNAETMLMNLARGAGLRGMCGIPPVRGRIARPLLEVTRRQIDAWFEETGVPHVEDSSNALDEYARNRVRHRAIPVLRELNPRFIESASRAAGLLREDEDYLSGLAESFIAENLRDGSLPAAKLAELPVSISSRVLRIMSGREPAQVHIEALLALCRSPDPWAKTDLPGRRVSRARDRVLFAPLEERSFRPTVLTPGESVILHGAGLKVSCRLSRDEINTSLNIFHFPCDSLCGNIVVRPRQPGDRIRLAGRNVTKTLKKLFTESGIALPLRAAVPVLADDRGVIAVAGFGVDERFAQCRGACVTVEIESYQGDS